MDFGACWVGARMCNKREKSKARLCSYSSPYGMQQPAERIAIEAALPIREGARLSRLSFGRGCCEDVLYK